jgi:hypothetical protein
MNVINNLKRIYSLIVAGLFAGGMHAQESPLRVLFIGNSYTHTNNIPGILQQLAIEGKKSFYTENSTPSGYFLSGHVENDTTQALIRKGQWNYIVVQEQSQFPASPDSIFFQNTYVHANSICDTARQYNPGVQLIFYKTWGRKNGDQQKCAEWPEVCTYEGMDSLLSARYTLMADTNNAIIAPAGDVWKYLRLHHPEIELYNPDGSHPNLAGSYTSALTFYTILFRSNPEDLTFTAGLDPNTARIIREAVRIVVYEDLDKKWLLSRLAE